MYNLLDTSGQACANPEYSVQPTLVQTERSHDIECPYLHKWWKLQRVAFHHCESTARIRRTYKKATIHHGRRHCRVPGGPVAAIVYQHTLRTEEGGSGSGGNGGNRIGAGQGRGRMGQGGARMGKVDGNVDIRIPGTVLQCNSNTLGGDVCRREGRRNAYNARCTRPTLPGVVSSAYGPIFLHR